MNLQMIKDMLEKQYTLNNHTNGQHWVIRKTKSKKDTNFARAIYMECAELIDSYPWKHWKNTEDVVDTLNVKIEMIDILHFILSLGIEYKFSRLVDKLIVMDMSPEEIDRIFYDYVLDSLAEDFLRFEKEGISAPFKERFTFYKEQHSDMDYLLHPFEVLLRRATKLSMIGGNKEKQEEVRISFEKLVKQFFYISYEELNIDLPLIYRLYMGKNILNEFRQDHGYKEGIYIKHWRYADTKKEDNVIMFELVFGGTGLDNLYEELEEAYKLNL